MKDPALFYGFDLPVPVERAGNRYGRLAEALDKILRTDHEFAILHVRSKVMDALLCHAIIHFTLVVIPLKSLEGQN
jgi:hypothetical protein